MRVSDASDEGRGLLPGSAGAEAHIQPKQRPLARNTSVALGIDTFPVEIREILSEIDDEGNGYLEMDEITEVFTQYVALKRAAKKGSIAIAPFPPSVQETLKIFDASGDGTIEAVELARAGELYLQSKNQVARLTRLAIVLVIILALVLGIGAALTSVVVESSKETGASGSILVEKATGDVMSIGILNEVAEVFADRNAFANLVEGELNMFAERPEAVAVGLSNGDTINFPVDYMATTNTSAEVRNLQLSISLAVSTNATPTFTYPRGGAGSGVSTLTYIRVYARKGISLVLSSSRQADDTPDGVLATPTDSSTAASDRTTLAAELAKAGRVPVSDLPTSSQATVAGSASRGADDTWLFLFRNANASMISSLCEIVAEFGGRCSNQQSAETLQGIAVTISSADLVLLVIDPRMHIANGDTVNQYGLSSIEKDQVVSGPSYHRAREADPHQRRRHDQAKHAAFSTQRGRHLLSEMKRRSLSENWFSSAIAASNGTDTPANCFVKPTSSSYYTQGANTVKGRSDLTCAPWEPWEADLENTGIVAGEINCRQIAAWGEFYEKPLCPVIMDNGERWYWWCDVPHCVESVYQSNPLGLSNTDYNWGLERILDNETSFDFTIDRSILDGTGVHCFIMDSGVDTNHVEFQGATIGEQFDAFTNTVVPNGDNDDHGHGTHVAGILMGNSVGVAPGCTLWDVKALDASNVGTGVSMTNGYNYVIDKWAEIKSQDPDAKGVLNLSLNGGWSPFYNSLVAQMQAEGLVVVSAAGNSDDYACDRSPAGALSSVTVGATQMDDTKALFSSWGNCVNIWAPGAGINSAKGGPDPASSEYEARSGTSMATPFVSGVLALYLKVHPWAEPAMAKQWLYDVALAGVVHAMTRTSWTQLGGSDDSWDSWQANQNSGLLDEEQNLAAHVDGNRLLHVPGALDPEPCPQAGSGGFGPWVEIQSCPPVGSLLCGSPDIPGPWDGGMNDPDLDWPVRIYERKCVALDCLCDPLEPVITYVQCAESETDYTYREDACVIPAAMVKDVAYVRWLEGKRLTYEPDDSFGSTMSVCHTNGLKSELPFPPTMEGSLDRRTLSMGDEWVYRWGIGFGGKTFLFKGVERPTVDIYSNGVILFPESDEWYWPPRDGDLSTHLNNLGLAPLYTDLNPDAGCGLDSCGSIQIDYYSLADSDLVMVISWIDIPSFGAALGDGTNTFQIILHLDSSGKWEAAYGMLSDTIIGSATIGASPQTRPGAIDQVSLQYEGCFEDNGNRAFGGWLGYRSLEDCARAVYSAGYFTFGMQWPQGADTPGHAECYYKDKGWLGTDGFLQVSDDGECAGIADFVSEAFGEEFDHLGSGWRLAVYTILSPADDLFYRGVYNPRNMPTC